MSPDPSHPLARRLQVRERGAWRTIQLPPQEIYVGRGPGGLGARTRTDPDVVLSLRPTLDGILITPATPGSVSVNGEPLDGPRVLGKYDLLEIAEALLRTDAGDSLEPSEDWTSAETVISEDGLQVGTPQPQLPKVGEGLFAERYSLQTMLGQGGFGAVYKAWDNQLQRAVAIKVLVRAEGRSLQRFAMEIRATAALRHPNLVTVFDSGIDGERPYLVMELIEGRTLDAMAEAGIPPTQAAAVLQGVTQALSYAHQQGLLHRDIKPQNMMVGPDGQGVLLDFGLVRVNRSAEQEASRITREGTRLGTLPYMSPEQAFAADIDERSEVYSLGASLYHALTGQFPFKESVSDIVIAIASRDPVRPRELREGIPPDLEAICRKCMEKRAADRYPTAAALSADLGRFLAGEPTLARPLTPLQRIGRRLQRDRQTQLIAGGALVAIGLLGIAAGVVSSQRAQIELAEDKLAHEEAEERARLEREADEELRRREAEDERQRALGQRAEQLRELLDQIEEQPDAADEEAAIRACSRTGPEIAVPILCARLTSLAERLLDNEARLYAAANALQPGEETLPGVEGAIRARISGGPLHVYTAQEARTLKAVQLRLRQRAKQQLGLLPDLSAHMATAHGAVIPAGRFKVASIACKALRQLSADDSFDALAAYLHAEWDPLRAAEAGLALSELSHPRLLDHLLATHRRMGPDSIYSRRLRETLSDLSADQSLPSPTTAEGWLDRARFHAALRNDEACLAAAKQALAIDSRLDEAYMISSIAKLNLKDLEGARADMDAAIKLLPMASELWSNRSNLRLMQGDVQGALSDASQALKLNPRNTLAGFNLAQALRTAGQPKKALLAYSRVLQLDPTYAGAWAERSALHLQAGDTAAALNDAQEAVRLEPRDAAAWATLGRVRFELKQMRAAVEAATRAVDLEPQSYVHRANRGLYHSRLANYRGAYADYDAAVRMAKKTDRLSALLVGRASARIGLGERKKALRDLDEALEVDPKNVTGRRLRASVYSVRADWAHAAEDLEALTSLTPEDATTWARLADALYRTKRIAEGDEALKRATALAPNATLTLTTHALRFQLARRDDKAIELYTRAIDLSPQTAFAYRLRGGIYLRLGKKTEAIDDYETYLRLAPSSPYAAKVRETLETLR